MWLPRSRFLLEPIARARSLTNDAHSFHVREVTLACSVELASLDAAVDSAQSLC